MSFQPCTPEEGYKILQQMKKEIHDSKQNQKTFTWVDKASKIDTGSLIQYNGQNYRVDTIETNDNTMECYLKPYDSHHPSFINHTFNLDDDVTFVRYE